jgi:hypothetical protein
MRSSCLDAVAAVASSSGAGPGVLEVNPGRDDQGRSQAVETAFSVEDRTFMVVSGPAAVTRMIHLVTVQETAGPDRGRQLRVQVRRGQRWQESATTWPAMLADLSRAGAAPGKSR